MGIQQYKMGEVVHPIMKPFYWVHDPVHGWVLFYLIKFLGAMWVKQESTIPQLTIFVGGNINPGFIIP